MIHLYLMETRKSFGTLTLVAQDIWMDIETVSYHSKKKYGGLITYGNDVNSKTKCIGIIGKKVFY